MGGTDCYASAGMSVFAAMFFVVMPITALLMKKSRDHAAAMLSASEDKVSRARATVVSKNTVAQEGKEGSTSFAYFFEVEFEARHRDGCAYKVKSKVPVGEQAFMQYNSNDEVEVLFPVDEERRFELVINLADQPGSALAGLLLVFLSLFSLAGLGILALAVQFGNCVLGIPVFAVFVAAMLTCAWFQYRQKTAADNQAIVTSLDGQVVQAIPVTKDTDNPPVIQATPVGGKVGDRSEGVPTTLLEQPEYDNEVPPLA